MDFIESAKIIVPALTGMDLTVYDGKPEPLTQFENKCCFSIELQPVYTQNWLTAFLESASEEFIYDMEETLGTRLVAAKAGGCWVLLGPYVEEGWSEHTARVLLTRLGASESVVLPYKAYRCKLPIIPRDYAVRAALLVAEHTSRAASRQVKPFRISAGRQVSDLAIPDAYHDISIINRRYALESL